MLFSFGLKKLQQQPAAPAIDKPTAFGASFHSIAKQWMQNTKYKLASQLFSRRYMQKKEDEAGKESLKEKRNCGLYVTMSS